MKHRIKPPSSRRNCHRRGAMLVQIAIMMIGFMLAIAFSVDIAQMTLTQTEMKTATEAAAKAVAGTLADTQDRDLAVARGQQIASANRVNGKPLILQPSDINFGRSVELKNGRFKFESVDSLHNSVFVRGQQTFESPSGPTPLIFSKMFGIVVFEPKSFATATYVERDIVLVVDRSDAMSDQDFKDLHHAITTFTSALTATPSDERVGLASYSSQATEDVPLTDQMTEITDGVSCLDIAGSNNLSQGMLAGANILKRCRQGPHLQRTLVVMAKGVSTTGAAPQEVAASLAAEGIQIFTVTFGAETDEDGMKQVAAIGNGRYFHAEQGSDLERVYSEIAKSLSTMITQ